MVLIPAWHIGVLALLYAGEYVWRAWKVPEKRFMYIGKAFGRLLLGGVYLLFALKPLEPEIRTPLVRWALTMFLAVDLFYAAQEHVMRRVFSHADQP